MMKSLRIALFLISLCLSTVFGAEPTILRMSVSTSARLMDEVSMTCDAASPLDPRPLDYEWAVTSDPTGKAVILSSTSRKARLQLWWPSPSTAESFVGSKIEIRVRVSFEGATEEDTVAERTAVLTISGVNHPPVPVIGGNVGTRDDRIPSGNSVQVNSFQSIDPDGDAFRSDWGLGNWRGGRYIRPPVLYGSEGSIASFTVPEMTTNVDQTISLHLSDGLHLISKETVAYLKPADVVTPPSSAPVLTVPQPTVSVVQGQMAELQAVGTDSDGDDLSFTWVFLQGGTTLSTGYVTSRRTSTTTWVSGMSYPTSALAPGTYSFSVQATEAGKLAGQSTQKKFISLVVGTSGGGSGLDQNRPVCGQNPSPSLVSIAPDPRLSRIVLTQGKASTVDVTMQDYSEVTSLLGGSKKGLSEISWNVDTLSQLGITATSNFSGTVDPFRARSILTLTAGQSAPSTARVTAVAKDVEGCSSTISFDVAIEQAKTNEKPVPRLRYDAGSGVKSATNGANVEVNTGQVELDAGATTDDSGSAGLTYRWTIAGQATLSASSGEKVTLSIPDSTTGPVTVTLSVTDTGGLSSNMTVAFKLVTANESPVALIRYDSGSWELGSALGRRYDRSGHGPARVGRRSEFR